MNKEYSIHLQGREQQKVGTLWLNSVRGHVSSAFAYSPQWLASPSAFSLSPDLPLDQYPRACDELFSCFRDCAPDRWGRELFRRWEGMRAQREERTPRTLFAADFLLHVQDCTREGALRISPDGGRTFLASSCPGAVPPLTSLPALLCVVQRVCQGTESEADLQLLVDAGASLGGARPKASVLGAKGELFIAKFPKPDDERDLPLWEYVTYRLARRAGLNTPCVSLKSIAGKSVLLVRRFDRVCGQGDDRHAPGRIPFLSAMSLVQAKDGDHSSYAEIASAMESEGVPLDDMREFWARLVFNILVYNVDDHLKNHGFLREASGWHLSPVYDLETSHPEKVTPCCTQP